MPAIGDLLSQKYRVLAKLGEGGMGVVYHAENIVTGKQVAVKWMHPHIAVRPEAVSRLLREAQAASRLSHPHLVDVYDIVQDGEVLFLVMELLRGESLRVHLAQHPECKLSELIALLLPALDGIATAHELGVIHRDLKPDNIFVVRNHDGTKLSAKIVDFGVAKLSTIGGLTLTQTGTTMGTPVYMSLEQLSGSKDIDGRADVYSIGAILYEALAGQTPYVADSVPELAFKIAAAEPEPIAKKRDDIPMALAAAVDRAVRRERDQRTPDMRALMSELERFAKDSHFLRDPAYAEVPKIADLSLPIAQPTLPPQRASTSQTPPPPPTPKSETPSASSKQPFDDSLIAKDLPSHYRAPRHSRWGMYVVPALALVAIAFLIWVMRDEPDAVTAEPVPTAAAAGTVSSTLAATDTPIPARVEAEPEEAKPLVLTPVSVERALPLEERAPEPPPVAAAVVMPPPSAALPKPAAAAPTAPSAPKPATAPPAQAQPPAAAPASVNNRNRATKILGF